MLKRIISICLVPFFLSGCGSMLETKYTRPELSLPTAWSTSGNAISSTAEAAKWAEGFGDSELLRLVRLALERNNNLAAAAFRVRQARLEAGLAHNDMLPQLSAGLGANNKQYFNQDDLTNSYSASFDVSYEVDLWGKLARSHDAAKWEAVATYEDRLATALTLVGTTMELYWKIAYYNVRLRLSGRNIESSEETLKLMTAQQRYGAASDLEVNEARQDLASLRAEHYSLIQERQESINALAVLFDMPPGKVMADPQDLISTELPDIPAGLPAELLGRRPDLRAAEFRLRKLLAGTDAVRASFYPALSLTGSLGGSSAELANLLDNPFAALASSLTFPFLNWNRLELNLDESKAEYDEAVVSFRQSLYEAMKEVENALSNRVNLVKKGVLLDESLNAALKVEHIYEVRYKSGSGTLKDWLDSQDTRRSAEEAVATNMYNQLLNYVSMYEALGGNTDTYSKYPEKAGSPG